MKFFYPIAVKLDIQPTKDPNLLRVFYREDFGKDVPDEVFPTTLRALEYAVPLISEHLRVSSGKRWVAIRGRCTREQIGDFMLGEFMHWGTIGDVKLRTIFETATSAVAYKASLGAL